MSKISKKVKLQKLIDFYTYDSIKIDENFLISAIKLAHPVVIQLLKSIIKISNAENTEFGKQVADLYDETPETHMFIVEHNGKKYSVSADVVSNKWKRNMDDYKNDFKLFQKLINKISIIMKSIQYLFLKRLETRIWKTPQLIWLFKENNNHVISYPKGSTQYISLSKKININATAIITKLKNDK